MRVWGRSQFSENLLVFGNKRIMFDCFQIWFLGSAGRLFQLFAGVYALELLFHGPTEPYFINVSFFNVNLVKCRMCKITFSIWFCERLTLSESVWIFGEKQLTLTCFQMWFKYKGIRCSVESRKVKPSFSNWFSERTTLLESNSMFDIARWTLLVFVYGIWAPPLF